MKQLRKTKETVSFLAVNQLLLIYKRKGMESHVKTVLATAIIFECVFNRNHVIVF